MDVEYWELTKTWRQVIYMVILWYPYSPHQRYVQIAIPNDDRRRGYSSEWTFGDSIVGPVQLDLDGVGVCFS
jgi:hypothetical protein